MAPSSKGPKTMSSRLLTMKFMQRAAGAASLKAQDDNSTPDRHSSKRVRLSNGMAVSPSITTPSDYDVVQAALAAEELKRSQAIERQAAEAGETRWVLSFQDPVAGQNQNQQGGLQVVSRGFADIDRQNEEDSEEEECVPGRKVFGQRGQRTNTNDEDEDEDEDTDEAPSGSDSSDEGHSEVEYDPADPKAGIIKEGRRKAEAEARAENKAKRKTLRTDSAKTAAIKRHKDVKLSKLTSISVAGGGIGARGGDRRIKGNVVDVVCHHCGKRGHKKIDCPGKSASERYGKNRGLNWDD